MTNFTRYLFFPKVIILLAGLIWLSCGEGAAQAVIMEGHVYGADHKPLEFANVIAHIQKDSSIHTFGITNGEGRFRIELDQNTSYLLKVIYLGYEEWSERIATSQENLYTEIALQQAANNLEEVTVVYELPVAVFGDTTKYKVDAFTNGKERKLKDVFEKLPGFEVGDNGEVKVNGEKVDKITVDGKEFFTGDTKLATQNIPANVVDKVNVLSNHNEIDQMKNFEQDNQLAIDLELKADKQNIVFGSAEAGGGLRERYIGHTNVFFFNPKLSASFIGNVNNIGDQVFTFQDYFRFNGGMSGVGKRNGVSMRLSSDDLGLSLLQENKAKNMETKLGAFSFTYNPNKVLSFSGFAIVSDINARIEDRANRLYIREENNQETLLSTNQQKTYSGIIRLNSEFTPNSNLYVSHNLVLKKTESNQKLTLLSESDFLDRDFDTNRSNTIPSLKQNLEIYYTENFRNISSLEFSQELQDKVTLFDLATATQIYPTMVPLRSSPVYELLQQSGISTNKVDLKLSHYFILNKTNHLSFMIGGTLNNQRLDSGLKQRISIGNEIDIGQEDNWGNEVNYQFRDAYAGATFKSKLGKLTLNPGLTLHRFSLENRQLGKIKQVHKSLLLPSFIGEYDFKKSVSLKLDYSIQAMFFDVQAYAVNRILRAYNDLYYGNRNLTNSWYHNLSLNYYSLNLFNFTNIYGVLSYQKKYNHLSNQLFYNNIERISTPVNISEPNDFLSAYMAYDRRFKPIKIKLSSTVSYSKSNNLFEDQTLTVNQNFTQQYTGSVETTMDNFPVLEIGFEHRISDYSNNAISKQQFINSRPFANIEVSFLKHLILVADYEYNWYKSKDSSTSGSYDILNAALYFKKEGSSVEIKLSCLNLLDNRSIRRDFFSEALISTNEYFIQSRYILGSLKYDF